MSDLMPDVAALPAYAEGFYDAQSGEGLFSDADDVYAIGWRAYWACRELLKEIPSALAAYKAETARADAKWAI